MTAGQLARPSTAIVVLAAGASRRMGRPKQLETWQGQPLLRHVAATALEAQLGPVIVVLGAHADVVRPVIEDLACVIATCPDRKSTRLNSSH